MKTRILAVLLALAVVLALALPALAAVPADTVPYNTGTRHETCTALSTQAEQYYTDGAETLLKLSGSTSDSSLESMDSALYRALQSLMTDTYYGSDVEATLRAGYDIRHGLIGAGVYASHGYERSHRDGVLNTLRVLRGYLF